MDFCRSFPIVVELFKTKASSGFLRQFQDFGPDGHLSAAIPWYERYQQKSPLLGRRFPAACEYGLIP